MLSLAHCVYRCACFVCSFSKPVGVHVGRWKCGCAAFRLRLVAANVGASCLPMCRVCGFFVWNGQVARSFFCRVRSVGPCFGLVVANVCQLHKTVVCAVVGTAVPETSTMQASERASNNVTTPCAGTDLRSSKRTTTTAKRTSK